MKNITYINGDATSPIGSGMKIIPHIANNAGAWGSGFVLALSKKWVQPERSYRNLYAKNNKKLDLGSVEFIPVENYIIVANMIGQNGIWYTNGLPPIRYDAVRSCLSIVKEYAIKNLASIHAPKFGGRISWWRLGYN